MSTADVTAAQGGTLDLTVHPREPRLTADALLTDASGDVTTWLTTSGVLTEAEAALSARSTALWSGAREGLAALVREQLARLDVPQVLRDGLVKVREVIEAGRSTYPTEERVVVDLTGHQFEISEHPSIDVVLGPQVICTFRLTVRLTLHVTTLALTVAHGDVVALTSGAVDVTVSLLAGDQELASPRHSFDPRLHVDLGNGIPIPFAGSGG